MPKKFGQNTKAAEAKARKEDVKRTTNEKIRKEKEDALWADDDPRIAKQAAKKKAEDEKKAEAARKRAEKKALEEKEQAELSKLKPKQPPPKVTRAEIEKQTEKEKAKAKATTSSTTTTTSSSSTSLSSTDNDEEDWEAGLEKNINHLIREEQAKHGADALIDARSVEEALSGLGVTDGKDKHPEKRLKAAYLAYESANLPVLRQENPGLKLSQYKEMLWKQWQKSPENPLNQIAVKK
eukprot:TRINITY_DN3731_c0_g1_i2.p1 TRINITY_DN3731_c0_g1~~TRINITY_DN3731_c0_g1_i2.p1  ORF type:complete len:257 (+),score=100.98 TRINITY_DN3731_c0_g1_i2:59-772(+)